MHDFERWREHKIVASCSPDLRSGSEETSKAPTFGRFDSFLPAAVCQSKWITLSTTRETLYYCYQCFFPDQRQGCTVKASITQHHKTPFDRNSKLVHHTTRSQDILHCTNAAGRATIVSLVRWTFGSNVSHADLSTMHSLSSAELQPDLLAKRPIMPRHTTALPIHIL